MLSSVDCKKCSYQDKDYESVFAVGIINTVTQFNRYAAISTILIIAFLRSAHLVSLAYNREFSVARRSLPYILSSAQTHFCVRSYN